MDDTGAITRDNVYRALKKLGKKLTIEEIDNAFKSHDHDNSKTICFNEFKQMLIGDFHINPDIDEKILMKEPS